jgi:hypothetical protein
MFREHGKRWEPSHTASDRQPEDTTFRPKYSEAATQSPTRQHPSTGGSILTTFAERTQTMREQHAQGGLRGLPGQQSDKLGRLRDLIGRRFVIHQIEWQESHFDKDGQFAILTVELEEAPDERAKYATSGAWVTRQLQRFTPADRQLIYTVRELTDERPFNGYYPLVLDYALDAEERANGVRQADGNGSHQRHLQA